MSIKDGEPIGLLEKTRSLRCITNKNDIIGPVSLFYKLILFNTSFVSAFLFRGNRRSRKKASLLNYYNLVSVVTVSSLFFLILSYFKNEHTAFLIVYLVQQTFNAYSYSVNFFFSN